MIAAAFPYAQPGAGLVGGLMIGLAAAIMLLGLGRIAGVSGLTARATGIANSGTPRGIAIVFILGLPLGAFIVASLTGGVAATFPAPALLIIAGLIVGFGTRLGSGCTSGHGVCGLSRLSRRSMLATGLFMASGFATVAVMRLAGAL
ncbi:MULTISPECIES: YeeE/YedE family protein [unclassified Sphingobium]|uniref:YeeE/YedE family protein n=1 Tax=unclassified Sphingobium TaxID=2611147 RepID=UPI0007701D09|nr:MULTISPECIES: YeeE/YedE thiosulfate transporter family protein [Sphingomonadaceae]AMK25263.1 putative transporter component [Sphingobium sp. TKS]NML87920.1 YeeE/YedE family protein [Sphingobium sp. TB-6]